MVINTSTGNKQKAESISWNAGINQVKCVKIELVFLFVFVNFLSGSGRLSISSMKTLVYHSGRTAST
jgi:hypothetical protein